MTTSIMIVAGEASGDLHGSRLIRSMRSQRSDLAISGIGGIELEKAGVEILFRSSEIAVVGFLEVISHLKSIVAAQRIMRRNLESRHPKLLILIDFPDFNLILAKRAKKLGIPVFYYISPQVWAWRSGRVKKIGRLADKIGVILPFEEQFYQSRGVQAQYVGHPLLDSVRATLSRDEFCMKFSVDKNRPLIGILPGSRSKEIRHLLPVFLEAALKFQQSVTTQPVFLIPQASTVSEDELLIHGVRQYSEQLDIRIISSHRYELMSACDAAIAASGTVTLELVLLNTPVVVAYKLSPLTYRLGTLLVNISYFSLVNLIAGEEIVPELLQNEARADRICTALQSLLYDKQHQAAMQTGYNRVRSMLGTAGASDRAAKLALELLEKNTPPGSQ